MVVKKRLDYELGGYQSLNVPRGPRSVRRRKLHKKSREDSLCPFELLAAVAGKILQESESSASSNATVRDPFDNHQDDVKGEQFEEDKALRSKFLDQRSCIESAFTSDSAQENSKSIVEEIPYPRNDSVLDQTSIVTNPDITDIKKDINLDMKLEICTSNSIDRDLFDRVKGRSDDESLCDGKINYEAGGQVDDDKKQAGDLISADPGCINDATNNAVNNNVLVNSGSSAKLPVPFYRNLFPSASFAKHRNNVNLGIVRDDDENSFRCNITKIKAYKKQPRYGYRRIRKVLTSKYFKGGPKLKNSEFSYSYDGMKPFYRSRKSLGPRERWMCDSPSKRRKLCDHSFVVPFDQEASSESISNSPEKGVKGGNNGSSAFSRRGAQRLPSGKGLQKSRASNVKLSIKSFKVPELYIEVPETATVGALKRTVMEAVTGILRNGLRVGVVLQGKKVRDDNRTLQQAGLSERSNLETLGFTLEPSLNQVPATSPKKPSALGLPDDEGRLPRSPVTPTLELALPVPGTPNDPQVVQKKIPVEEKIELGLSPSTHSDSFTGPSVENSKSLVPIPSMNAEALLAIPVNQKPKRSELSHRRTRRPFSVGEVEALVEAVETLGTGRWRDVKMRSFDNADHRTYVDLKDKWKTLVHTASIAPQQRRGEPVPQDLLDRVLCAHGYWSLHQSKQHETPITPLQVEPPRIVDAQVESVGAVVKSNPVMKKLHNLL